MAGDVPWSRAVPVIAKGYPVLPGRIRGATWGAGRKKGLYHFFRVNPIATLQQGRAENDFLLSRLMVCNTPLFKSRRIHSCGFFIHLKGNIQS
jgi:hypothetical protein